jgi:4'-phosphopantetheinyl transferase
MIEIEALEITGPIPAETLRRLLRIVDAERRGIVERFRFPEDAQRSLLADILARAVIARRLRRPAADIVFIREPGRKPRLARAGNFDFNLSHAGRWVICVSGFTPVGVDVERIGGLGWEDAKSTLSTKEQERLDPSRVPEWETDLALSWTIKESYLKALGEGWSVLPSELTVSAADEREIRLFRSGRLVRDAFFGAYALDAEHCLAVCALAAPPPEAVTVRTLEDVEIVCREEFFDDTPYENR